MISDIEFLFMTASQNDCCICRKRDLPSGSIRLMCSGTDDTVYYMSACQKCFDKLTTPDTDSMTLISEQEFLDAIVIQDVLMS